MATSRTVFLNSNLSNLASISAKFDTDDFDVVMLNGGSAQIQAYLSAHAGASITVVSPSGASDGLFTPRVVFIDPSVADYQTLVAGMPAGCTVVVLDAARDGIQQMRDFLANNVGQVGAIDIVSNIASLDVVSHGAPGEVVLGSTVLNASTMAQYASQLAEIGSHMTSNGDILLYGCDVAAGAAGQAFISGLAQATGADVAASTDLTGSAAAGGDWVLEASAGGAIETAALSVANYDVLLPVNKATITAISTDSGNAGDFITNDTTLTFSGKYTSNKGSSDMFLWVSNAAGTTLAGTVSVKQEQDNVDWSFDYATALKADTYTIIINTNQNNATSGELFRRTVTIDTSTAAPNVALTSDTGTAGDGITRIGTLAVTGVETGAAIDYSNNGGAFTSTFTAVEGNNNVVVRATDIAGNVATRNFNFVLDTTATQPTVALSVDSTDGAAGHNSDLITNNAALSVSALEAGASRTFKVDSAAASSTYTAPTTQGSHTVIVADTDAAGNSANRSFTFTLDTLADPEGDLNVTLGDTLVNASERTSVAYTVSGLNADANATVTFSDGVNTVVGNNGTVNLSSLNDGQVTVTVSAKDFAGNVANGVGASLILDTRLTAPTLALTLDSTDGGSGHNSDGRTNSAALTFSTKDADAVRVITVDGQPVASYNPAGLADGAHTVMVTDTDAAGNTAQASLSFTLDRVVATPTVALFNDTGDQGAGHGTDRRTSDATLSVSALEADASKRVVTLDGQTVSNYNPALVAEGDHTVVITDTDHAGNTASSSTLQFTIDRTIAKATVSLADDTTDGAVGHNSDHRTSNATLTISALEADASKRVITVDGQAVDSYNQASLAEGDHTVVVTDTDHAGNTISSDTLQFIVDRTIAKATVALADDTTDGAAGHNSDHRTSNAALTISALEADATKRVITVDGQAVANYNQALTEGEHTVVITDTDHAGNTISSDELKFTVDRSIAKAMVSLADDTTDGAAGHNSDHRTSNAALTISALDADATKRVITVDGQVVANYNQASLTEGEHTVVITDTDHAGNTISSDELKFTVDRSIAKATVSLADDTTDGAAGHSSDHRTNNAALNISALEADASKRVITVDGQAVANYNQASLTEGEHTVVITDTDHAGNTISSDELKFTVDRSIAKATVSLADDTTDGAAGHNSDHRTSNAALTISALEADASKRVITVDGQAVANYNQASLAEGEHTVVITDTDHAGNTISSDELKFTVDRSIAKATVSLADDTTDGAAGHNSDNRTSNASLTISALEPDASKRVITVDGQAVANYNQASLTEGEHTVVITDTDHAGNTISSDELKFTVDRSIAKATVSLSDDTTDGAPGHNSDHRTSNASLSISALETDASKRVITVDGQAVANYNQASLAEGEHTVVITDTDHAGNTISSDELKFTVDRSIAKATVSLADDTTDGAAGHNSDHRTSNAALTISALEADATKRVITVDGQAVANYNQASLAEGEHTVVITDTDHAGNTISSDELKFTVDRSIAKATVSLADDTTDGAAGHNSDHRTSNAALTISALEADATKRVITVDGQAVANYNQASLAEGEHTVVITDTDHAGNTISSDELKFTVDRSIAKATVSLADDTTDGAAGHNSDHRTNNASLTISALETDASKRVITVDGQAVANYNQASLTEGEHTVVITDTDHAGNTISSDELKFTVDRSIAKATVSLADDTTDGAAGHNSDHRTSNAALTISALEADASKRVITVDGQAVASYNQAALAEGEHTVVITDTDHAGNTIRSDELKFTIDRTISASSINLATDSTDGAAGHATDKLTNSAALVFSALDQDATRTYKVNGNSVAAYDPGSLQDGTHTVEVFDIDSAGNKSSSSFTFTLDTTLTAPTLGLALDSSDGQPGHDSDKVSNGANINFGAKDADANRVILVDGNATPAYNPAALADGKHTVTVTDTDAAGNRKSASLEFTLDTKAAAALSMALTSDSTDGATGHNSDKVTSNAAITFGNLEAGAARSFSINGGPASTSYAMPSTDGNYSVAVTDTDIAGNSTTTAFAFTLDTKADLNGDLKVTLADQLINKAERTAVAYSVQGLDADANAKVTFSNGANTVIGKNGIVDLSSLADGTISVSIVATDFAGNTATGAGASLVLDTTAPVFTSAATATVAENAGANATVYTAQTDDLHGPQYSLLQNNADDAAAFTIGSDGIVRMTAAADFETKSSYKFTVVAMDLAGNASQKAVTLPVTDVNEAPDTTPISLNTVENATILIPIVPDYAFDVDANDVLVVSSVSSVTLTWAPETTVNTFTNPVTKQQLTLGQVYATAAISSDGKAISISPSAEFDWATTGQKVLATVTYSVKDKAGLVTQGTATLAIWGSTSDKGKNLTGTNGADVMVGVMDNENVLQGANGNDNLTGGNVTDALYGGSGDDKLLGGGGIDYLYGDSGNDTLEGGDERDLLFGGKGNDILNGGSGADYFVFEPQMGSDRIVGLNLGEGDKLFFLDFFNTPMSAHDFVGKYAKTVGADTVITLSGGSVTLVGVTDKVALEGAISFSL
ncbi:Ig-like domain-containing protein [Pseudoduganella sp. OTU4001]|uniref:Ig-like domain-containing protein n=1 Tax=Pseudoduganella sp. OTU4001 TaxID=3043854 RepID=UPI00313BCF8E